MAMVHWIGVLMLALRLGFSLVNWDTVNACRQIAFSKLFQQISETGTFATRIERTGSSSCSMRDPYVNVVAHELCLFNPELRLKPMFKRVRII